MNAFIQIAQKVLHTKNEVYPITEMEQKTLSYKLKQNKIDMPREISQKLWLNYYKCEILHDCQHTSPIYWMYYYITISSVYNKIKKYKQILENPFISEEIKTTFGSNFAKTQRTYRAFSQLALLYKKRCAPLVITTDLLLNEIDQKHRNTINIYHEGVKYLFTLSDLLQHIETALINSPYYFSEPLIIKNPYNNVKFTKSILYNIYFRVIDSNYKFPILFHNFVWLDFDLYLFRTENEYLIRETYFRKYIYNTPDEILNAEIICMLEQQYPCNIYIDKDFPKKKLIELFRPHYYLYLIMRYHISGLEKVQLARNLFVDKMCELCEQNHTFGRKYISIGLNGKNIVKFNDKIPKFTMNDAYKYHLVQKRCDVDTDDSECESDTDSVS